MKFLSSEIPLLTLICAFLFLSNAARSQEAQSIAPPSWRCSSSRLEVGNLTLVTRRDGIRVFVDGTAKDGASRILVIDTRDCLIEVDAYRKNLVQPQNLDGRENVARKFTWLNQADFFNYSPKVILREENGRSVGSSHLLDLARRAMKSCARPKLSVRAQADGEMYKCELSTMKRLLRKSWSLNFSVSRGLPEAEIHIIVFSGSIVGYDYIVADSRRTPIITSIKVRSLEEE
jgi:hypothetical protein